MTLDLKIGRVHRRVGRRSKTSWPKDISLGSMKTTQLLSEQVITEGTVANQRPLERRREKKLMHLRNSGNIYYKLCLFLNLLGPISCRAQTRLLIKETIINWHAHEMQGNNAHVAQCYREK